jgi:hypothetical protein
MGDMGKSDPDNHLYWLFILDDLRVRRRRGLNSPLEFEFFRPENYVICPIRIVCTCLI